MVGSKISLSALRVTAGVSLGVAILLAAARAVIRFRRFRRFFADDAFLFFATVTLVIGTILFYIDVPEIYTQINVEDGTEYPPADFVQQLLSDDKYLVTCAVLLWLTVFGVKFSFLLFFRQLIRRIRKLVLWWWIVFAILIPASLLCICQVFIACPAFGPALLEKCASSEALAREFASIQAGAILDILTDVLLISIPVGLLWRVRLTLRKKLLLGFVLCLSIFMIMIEVVKVTTSNLSNGQVDTSWSILCLQVEASVAVIVVSLSSFRSLFLTDGIRQQRANPFNENSEKRLWQRSHTPLPSIPSAVYVRNTTCTSRRGALVGTPNPSFTALSPVTESGIRVTHDIRTYHEKISEDDAPSHGSFV